MTRFGNIGWTDDDRVRRMISQEIPDKVATDETYQNAQRNNDEQNARIESEDALQRAMFGFMKDDTELFKQYSDNESFRRWLQNTVFAATYRRGSGIEPSAAARTGQGTRRV